MFFVNKALPCRLRNPLYFFRNVNVSVGLGSMIELQFLQTDENILSLGGLHLPISQPKASFYKNS